MEIRFRTPRQEFVGRMLAFYVQAADPLPRPIASLPPVMVVSLPPVMAGEAPPARAEVQPAKAVEQPPMFEDD